MRADVRRNRRLLLDAAVAVLVEQGGEAPLDTIAKRAGLGAATLYRHFPSREALIKAVALHSFDQVAELAEQELTGGIGPAATADADRSVERQLVGEPDALPAQRRCAGFARAVLELRLGAFMPSLLPQLAQMEPDEHLDAALARMLRAVDQLVDEAQRCGELRGDVAAEDLLVVLAVVSRPLEGLPPEFSNTMMPRLLAIAMDGLRPPVDGRLLPTAPGRAARASVLSALAPEDRR